MLDRFEKTEDPLTAGHVLQACVLRDDALPDMTRLLPLTARRRPHLALGHLGARGGAVPRRQVRGVRPLLRDGGEDVTARGPGTGASWPWPHHRLGHAEEARRCVAEATRWIDEANRVRAR